MRAATRLPNVLLVLTLLTAALSAALATPAQAHAQTTGWSWQVVGNPVFTPADAFYVDLAVNSQLTPYVAYADGSQDMSVVVRKHYGAGWQDVGLAGLPTHPVAQTRIALDSAGRPWVAFLDENPNSQVADQVTVIHFDGAQWQSVGAPRFSAGAATSLNLALDRNDVPYVAYVDAEASSKLTVMKYSASHGWQNVGAAGFTPDLAQYASLALDSQGVPYVAFSDAAHGSRISVMKFNGSAWVQVGAAGFSSAQATYTSIALNRQDLPYVAFADASADYKCTVMAFDGAAWAGVGPPSFSQGRVSFVRLQLDPSNRPFVGYADYGNSGRATVMSYDPATEWLSVGTPGFSPGEVWSPSMVLDGNGAPWMVFGDLSSSRIAQAAAGGSAKAAAGSGATPEVMRYHPPVVDLPVIALITPGVTRASTGWYNRGTSGSGGLTVQVNAVYGPSSAATMLNLTCVDGLDNVVLNLNSAEGSGTLTGAFHLDEGVRSFNCMATNNQGDIGADPGSTVMPVTYGVDQTLPQLQPAVTPDPALQYFPASATPNATDDLSGIATEACDPVDTSRPGDATVTCSATDGAGNTNSAIASYTVNEVHIASLELEPGPIVVTVGQSRDFAATVRDEFDRVLPLEPAWSTDVGSMNGPTLTAAAHPASGHVVAALAGIESSVPVNVVPGAPVRIAIAPPSANLVMGQQQSFTFTAFDAYANAVALPAASWSVQPPAAGTISDGLFTAGRAAGTYPGAVRVTAGSLAAQADVRVRWGFQVYLPCLRRNP